MSEDKWKVIKIKFEQTLKSWELDKKTNQFTTDSICSLFPTEIEAIIKYIEELENNWNELKKWLEKERQELYKQFDNDINYMHYESQHSLGSYETLEEVLDKIQELEGNNE